MNVISAIFLIAGIHSTTNLNTYDQAKKLFKPVNTQSPFEESFKEKCKMFIGMCFLFTWFKMQTMNLYHR